MNSNYSEQRFPVGHEVYKAGCVVLTNFDNLTEGEPTVTEYTFEEWAALQSQSQE